MSLLPPRHPQEAIAKAVKGIVEAYRPEPDPRVSLYDQVIYVAERPLLEAVMQRARWNQAHAADMLGINRNTLRKKLRAHALDKGGR